MRVVTPMRWRASCPISPAQWVPSFGNVCIVNQHHCVECEVLFGAWTRWCDELHRDHKGTIQSFGRDLRAVVPDLEVTQPRDPRTGTRLRYYQGLGLLS